MIKKESERGGYFEILQRKEVFDMLNENIKAIRKSKGLSQEELAVKLNVVRQTISKWEKGLSVPDSEMLVTISDILETPVNTLLGQTIVEERQDDLKIISEKLEVVNLQLAKRSERTRKLVSCSLLCLFAVVVVGVIFFANWNSPYLAWDYSDPEKAVIGVALHSLEWLFVRLAPITLIGAIVGIFLARKK